ncbi:UNVERIFIED_CONTAM: hypothetical protein GTU68_020305 [Idotea baltica]|nr:hypothetical protein [Idotea baltica]
MINALGSELNQISERLFSADAEFNPLSTDTNLLSDQEQCLVGRVKTELEPLPNAYSHLDSRFARMLFFLYQQIQDSVDELKSVFGAERIGVVLGSSTSGIDTSEPAFEYEYQNKQFPDWYTYFHQEIGSGSAFLASLAGARGPAFTISTACSSSAKVFKSAENLLSLDVCDAVIVGGVDALCKMTLRGFKSLQLVSPTRSNPMSKNRNGLNIGEGGALFTLIRSPFGIQVRGVGESSDAYHVSSPQPDGLGAAAAMEQALSSAGASAENVRYVNMHGTGTSFNDSMESKAIARVVGCSTPCSSTKPLTGHLLGASGATEIGFCMLSLLNKTEKKPLPAHIWDQQRDDTLPDIMLASASSSIDFRPEEDLILTNSFAFGGSNCCVALGLGEVPE